MNEELEKLKQAFYATEDSYQERGKLATPEYIALILLALNEGSLVDSDHTGASIMKYDGNVWFHQMSGEHAPHYNYKGEGVTFETEDLEEFKKYLSENLRMFSFRNDLKKFLAEQS